MYQHNQPAIENENARKVRDPQINSNPPEQSHYSTQCHNTSSSEHKQWNPQTSAAHNTSAWEQAEWNNKCKLWNSETEGERGCNKKKWMSIQ